MNIYEGNLFFQKLFTNTQSFYFSHYFNFTKKRLHAASIFVAFRRADNSVGPAFTFKLFCFRSFVDLGAGLSVGLSGLAAGFAIGIVGDAGVRGTAQQPRLFVGMILILIFAEVLGLYGLIVALMLTTRP